VGFGFLGGIVGGFLSGYTILGLEKLLSKMPKNLDGLKAIFIYPLVSTFIVGLVMLGISGPMASINTGMMNFLKGLSSSGPIILGLAIGCMCAFDMGGPVNKAAYVTGTALLTEALTAGVGTDTYNFGTNFMAAVSAACIVPPLITAFAVIVGRKYFSQEDHDAGIVNIILGCTHITEGAIPFMTKNIWPVMPIMMCGSSIGAILSILWGVHDPAPHGGFLVLPVVDGAVQWVLAILIGTVVGGVLFVLFKKHEYEKNGNKLVA
jgi:PTS system fructose-specific IIC component